MRTEPLYDDEGTDARNIIGCVVSAYDKSGIKAEETIFYPDNWYVRTVAEMTGGSE